jgi:gliding motility-associated-like protein
MCYRIPFRLRSNSNLPRMHRSWCGIAVLFWLFGAEVHGQQFCSTAPTANMVMISGYDGGIVNLNVDENIPNLKVAVVSRNGIRVNFSGAFVANITAVAMAGFGDPDDECGFGVTTYETTGVPPNIVQVHSAEEYNGEVLLTPYITGSIIGLPYDNCFGSGSCDPVETPPMIAYFVDLFGPGTELRWHFYEYNCYNNFDIALSDGGNCCETVINNDPNPWYEAPGQYSLLPYSDTTWCGVPLDIDFSSFPVFQNPPGPPDAYYQGYIWSDGTRADDASNWIKEINAPGVYPFYLKENCGTLYDTLVVSSCCSIPAPLVPPDVQYCAGDPIADLIATPLSNGVISWYADTGLTILLDTGNAFTPSGAIGSTTYYVVEDTLYCTSPKDSVTVTVVNVQATITGDTTLCTGVLGQLTAAGGSTYLWHDGQTTATASGLPIGPASVVVTGPAGCTDSTGVTLEEIPLPLVDIGADTTLCPDATLLLDATRTGGTYLWSDNTTQGPILITQANLYWVDVTVNTCTARDSIIVGFHPLAIPELGPDTLLCTPGALTFSVVGNNANVSWLNVQTGQALGNGPSVTVDRGALVKVTVSNGFCSYTDEIQVNALPLISELDLGPKDPIVCPDQPVLLDATLARSPNYLWNTGDTNATLLVGYEGTYIAWVNGLCVNATDTVWARPGACGPFIYMPSAFSPNGDGVNDTWNFAANTLGERLTLEVFDRWGKVAFSTNDPTLTWDGTTQGAPAPTGIYNWRMTYDARLVNGDVSSEEIKGTVTIIR